MLEELKWSFVLAYGFGMVTAGFVRRFGGSWKATGIVFAVIGTLTLVVLVAYSLGT